MKFSMMQHKDRLSDEDRKARRLESARKYREANREKAREASRLSQAKRRLESQAVRDADKAYKQTEGYKEQQRRYRAENREMLSAGAMAWRLENPGRYAEYQRQYHESNREHTRARTAQWRKDNPERSQEMSRRWRQENPDLNVLKAQRYRVRKLQAGADLPSGIIKSLLTLQRCKCAVCKSSLKKSGHHLDHIMPLFLGGAHSAENVQLLCPTCNLSKSAKNPIDFMQSRGFLL